MPDRIDVVAPRSYFEECARALQAVYDGPICGEPGPWRMFDVTRNRTGGVRCSFIRDDGLRTSGGPAGRVCYRVFAPCDLSDVPFVME